MHRCLTQSSDVGAGPTPLPASVPLKPSSPVASNSSDSNTINCIPETPNPPSITSLLSCLPAPGTEQPTSRKKSSYSRKSNFEGFACVNGSDQLSLTSDMSEDEIPPTPTQQHATTSTKNKAKDFLRSNQEIEIEPDMTNSLGKVIIVEPVADTRPVEKFFSNDLTLSKALASSPFGRAGIAGVSKNLGRRILVITLEKEPGEMMPSLLEVNQLASWTIKCRLPVNFTKSIGVIGPLGNDVSGGDLEEALALAGFGGCTAERILKGKDKVPTSMFKVTFHSSTLPNFLNLGYQRFQVNPYIAKPWQCFKCQDVGHSAISCKKPPRCVVCSGAHNVKDCSHQGSPLCCNCGGQHTASYGGCSFMKEAKVVERIRVEQKVSYREAQGIVKQSANSNMSG